MSGPDGLWSLATVTLRRGALVLAPVLVVLFALASATPADAATVTVNSTGEEGIGPPDTQCTLNEALYIASNNISGYADCPLVGSSTLPNVVAFDIKSTPTQCNPVCTIKPSVTYSVSGQVTIDGYTQHGASPNTLAVGDNAVLRIELDGELAPDADGLDITGGTVTIRGLVINRHGGGIGPGRAIYVSGGSGHRIVGNFIGTDVTGSMQSVNRVGVRIEAPNTTVGGTTADARNVISGNENVNISTSGSGSTGTRIEGNYIGTNASGTGGVGFGSPGPGIVLGSAVNNTVGGTASGAGNVISGNSGGIVVLGATATGNVIQGNLIGVDATGTSPLANSRHGVYIELGASNTTVGGTEAGAGNTIAFNGSAALLNGVSVESGTGNAILGNRIFSNFALGIDLGVDGVTPHHAGVGAGPNNFQNFPVLTAASVSTVTGVGGTLNSLPNRVYRIELFANSACDASGNGEGQTFLGFTNVTTDGGGNAGFVMSLPAVPAGQAISATATNLTTNDTSEFSACRTVQQAGFTVSPVSGPTTEAHEGNPTDATFTVRLNSVPAADVTLALSVSDPTEGAIVGPTTLTFTPANATTAQTVGLIGVDDTLDDGNVAYAVVFAAATSSDAAYAGLKPPDLPVINLDDDTPCSPRPNVRVTTAAAGPGQLNATIAAQPFASTPANSLISVRITTIGNATVQLNGAPVALNQTVTLPGGTQQAVLLVRRQTAGQASTVAFTVSDGCGEWKSFVGGGAGAF